jgi:hypothetical protein
MAQSSKLVHAICGDNSKDEFVRSLLMGAVIGGATGGPVGIGLGGMGGP